MKRLIAIPLAAIAIIVGTPQSARADGEPVDTTSPYVQCSPDVCAHDLVPPPQLVVFGFFEGR